MKCSVLVRLMKLCGYGCGLVVGGSHRIVATSVIPAAGV